MQNHAREGGAFEAFSKFSCPVGWGIGGDLCGDCNVKDHTITMTGQTRLLLVEIERL